MYAATETGPVACICVSHVRKIEWSNHTVIASPSIFASGVDHFRCSPEDVVVDDDDHRVAHGVNGEHLVGSFWLHRVAVRSRLRDVALMAVDAIVVP